MPLLSWRNLFVATFLLSSFSISKTIIAQFSCEQSFGVCYEEFLKDILQAKYKQWV